MILSTSDSEKYLKTSLVYLIIAIFLAAAGAVYEHFSFGVYSYFMIYAFAIPLCLGALPCMIKYARRSTKSEEPDRSGRRMTRGRIDPSDLYHSAVASLTVGCIVHGALMICGRPNSLVIVYPIAGAAMLVMYCAAKAFDYLRTRRTI